jgi:hypothetical protein
VLKDIKKNNFYFNIFYSNFLIKFIFNKFFLKIKKKIIFFYKFLNLKDKKFFRFKIYFNKSLIYQHLNCIKFFNFYFLPFFIYFNKLYKIYDSFIINNKNRKLNNLIFRKRLITSQNVFNYILFDYYHTNMFSLIYLNNLYIFNTFNLSFFIKNNEIFNNIDIYNNLYPVFNNKNVFFESKFINKNIFSFDKFFNTCVLNFYENLFKSFFFFKLNFNFNLKNFYKTYYKTYPFSISNAQQDNYTIDEMFEIFCFSFVKRDISILNN